MVRVRYSQALIGCMNKNEESIVENLAIKK